MRAGREMQWAIVIVLLLTLAPATRAAGERDAPWVRVEAGEARVALHFFWTRSCPHCRDARPFVLELVRELPWIELHDHELTRDPGAARRYVELAGTLGREARSVPAFLFCGRMLVGFDDAAGVGAELRDELQRCRAVALAADADGARAADPSDTRLALPLIGEADLRGWSLPLVTVVLGALDSFNPCAFFVLLFLLSLLVNARSRTRMLIVGVLFVTVSGAVYFAFMAAWLNLFLLLGELYWVTVVAALLALLIGMVNVGDYFRAGAAPTLALPAAAKPGLFRRMRALIGAERLGAVLAGTFALAVVANAYELLCTAGFPMVFTRLLTLHALPTAAYYGYLLLYCVVYVIPLLTIVALFVLTLGRRKLAEREGRALKLVSGCMMLGLGAVLLFDPALLSDPVVAGGLLLGALLVSGALLRFGARRTRSQGEGADRS